MRRHNNKYFFAIKEETKISDVITWRQTNNDLLSLLCKKIKKLSQFYEYMLKIGFSIIIICLQILKNAVVPRFCQFMRNAFLVKVRSNQGKIFFCKIY